MSAAAFSHLSGPQRTARVRLVPSFATALLDGHFAHPVKRDSCCAVSADPRQFLIRRVCLKLLNNFKKLANAFLFCQGNKPRWVDVAEAAAESHEACGRFLDFHHA
jgi:hypothetical protein